ncbi:alpha/beta hydrolase [Enterobacter mori]|uniref:alpha/beta fold hydrolase n=1 Tax=Enterobacter mori TaxID=539813 RepID=UPI002ED34BCC|nr:alpha/beta hydrolase [Enterobacter mori]
MEMSGKNGYLYYRAKGRGPLVVLLHGLLMEGNSWLFNGVVDALSQNFCVAYPDMPGHGMSDKPGEASLYEQEAQASNINQLINTLGYSQAHVIGYSSGAWLAAGLVKYHPNALSSLIIGGWDVENGLPDGPCGKMDFDTFFTYAKTIAPELTGRITSDAEPAVRAYFNAVRSYDGLYDSVLLTQINVPKLFWAGLEDVYYRQLKSWCDVNKYTFIPVAGDHINAILKAEPALISRICEFITHVQMGNHHLS